MDIINKNIRYVRVHHRLTQAEFADKLNTTRDNISKYESKSIPKPDFLRLLSNTFDLNLHSFFFTEMNDSNYHLFHLDNESLSGNVKLDDEINIEKITAKDVRLFESAMTERINLLSREQLNNNDRQRISNDLHRYKHSLIEKLIEFYNKQSQLFEYLTDKGILPNDKS